MDPIVASLAYKAAEKLASVLFKRYASRTVMDWLKKKENRVSLSRAIGQAMESLYENGYAWEGPGALDERFFERDAILAELWDKLLDPSREEEPDIDMMFAELEQVYVNQAGFDVETKRRQREGIEFIVDCLSNRVLWTIDDLRPMLEAKIIRRQDSTLTALRRNALIRRYLELNGQHCGEQHVRALGTAVAYVEPSLTHLLVTPERMEFFSRLSEEGCEPEAGTKPGSSSPPTEIPVDVNDFLVSGSEQLVAVVADSGYGKTALLEEVMLRAARSWSPGRAVPFLFAPDQCSVRTVGDVEYAVFERLRAVADGLRDNQVRSLATRLLSEGRLLLLLDAVDQMPDAQGLSGLLSSGLLLRNRVIVTSRPAAWTAWLETIPRISLVRLSAFDASRRAAYFGKYLAQFTRSGIPVGLLEIPLLARLLVALRQDTGGTRTKTVMRNRSDVYRAFFKHFMNRPEDKRVVRGRALEDVTDDLRNLAFETLRRNLVAGFRREVAKEIVGERGLCDLERTQHAMTFLETGDLLSFRHRSFQDFLAAEVLLRWIRTTGVTAVRQYLYHPLWEEAVKFLAGLADKDVLAELVRSVLSPDEGSAEALSFEHLRLAGACMREAVSATAELEEEVGDALLPREPYPWLFMIDALDAWGAQRACDALLHLVDHFEDPFKTMMVRALGKARYVPAVEKLVEIAKKADDDTERAATEAAIALGHIGIPEVVPDLVSIAASQPERVSQAAIKALAQFPLEQTGPKFVELMAAPDPTMRARGAAATVALCNEAAMPAVIAMLRSPSATGPLRVSKAVRILLPGRTMVVSYVRAVITGALAKRGASYAYASVRHLLDDPDTEIVEAAISVLAQAKAREALPRLVELCKDRRHNVRAAAVTALGSIGDARFFPVVLSMAEDNRTRVWSAAREAVCKLATERDTHHIISLAQTGGMAFKGTLVQDTLVRLHPTEHLLALYDLLGSQFAAARQIAVAVIGSLGDRTLAPRLLPLLNDKDEWGGEFVVREAVKSLGKLRCLEAAPTILGLMNSSTEDDFRAKCLSALSQIAPPGIERVMVKSSFAEGRDERMTAMYALAGLGTHLSVWVLLRHYRSKDRNASINAFQALEYVETDEGLRMMIRAYRRSGAEGGGLCLAIRAVYRRVASRRVPAPVIALDRDPPSRNTNVAL